MKIIIADDQAGVRSALRFLVEQQARGCVIIEAADEESLLSEAEHGCPDIILLDAELEGFLTKEDTHNVNSIQSLMSDLRTLCPEVKVVALTSRPDLRRLVNTYQADVLISKADPPEALLDAIQSLCCDSE